MSLCSSEPGCVDNAEQTPQMQRMPRDLNLTVGARRIQWHDLRPEEGYMRKLREVMSLMHMSVLNSVTIEENRKQESEDHLISSVSMCAS